MDMLLLFMLFCTVPPFVLWSSRRIWALLQIPFVAGMWLYPFLDTLFVHVSPALRIMFGVIFYGNLVFTEAALIRFCIDLGNGIKARRQSA